MLCRYRHNIDDATRVIPFAAFAYADNTTAFLPVFKQAIARRGLPARLYVANGASFRSQPLALVCAKLGIALIHARPYPPAGTRAPPPTAPSAPRAPEWCARPSRSPGSSSTKRSPCATTSSKLFAG